MTKVILFLAVTRLITVQFGRPWSYLVVAIPLALVLVAHGWWLPRQGINGWTAEPNDRYLQIARLDASARRSMSYALRAD